MKILSTLLFTFLFISQSALMAQTKVFTVQSKANAAVAVEGNLNEGAIMSDLSWAWNSSNACFVSTKQDKYSGNHVIYQAELPRRAEMTVRLIPEDPTANFSLYAYSGSGDRIVPDLPSCVSCEADHKWDMKWAGRTQDHTRKVQLRAINNPYTVTIGVVGAHGLTEGAYRLEIILEGGE